MIKLRKAGDRFHTNAGWLDSWHTFSFGDHYDPEHMGFRSLRVNQRRHRAARAGFGTHPHRDMEILTYVLQGGLAHRDSTGGGGEIRPGDVQRMSAGTGCRAQRVQRLPDRPVHFLQIWIVPEQRGSRPGYEQKNFPADERKGALRLLASRDGREGSVKINQDAAVYGALSGKGRARHPPARLRTARLGAGGARRVELNGQKLAAGDGAAVSDERALGLQATDPAEVLVFDLA